ncbi:MAG: hypothetical protein HYY01_14480 [Chloroflexi bacterium]|nr:hypothetical protein [Chloroflexota bacterium]
MQGTKNLVRMLLPVAVGVSLLAAACSPQATTDVKGLLTAVEGKELIIQLDDGSTVRLEAKKGQPSAEDRALIGSEVKAVVKAEDSRSLVKMERLGDDEALRLRQRREAEVRQQERDRILSEDMHFSGVIQSMGSDNMVIGGRTLKVTAATALDTGLAVGSPARVHFTPMPDGSLLATEIETDVQAAAAAAKPAQMGVENFHLTGLVQSMGPDAVVIGGRTLKVNSATLLDSGLAAGGQAQAEFVTLPDGTLLAIEIETAKTAAPGAPATGAPVAKAPSMAEDMHFSGLVQSKTSDTLVIGGRAFKVNAATALDAGLATGVLARVEFVTLPDGSLLATEIETDAPDDAVASTAKAAMGVVQDMHLTETIQSMGPEAWTIGGRNFKVNAATRLDSGLVVGAKVKVEFVTLPDGSLLATEIETDAPQAPGAAPAVPSQPGRVAPGVAEDMHFSGTIESIGAGEWVIGGKTFKVDIATALDTGLAVGVLGRVEFVVLPDGSLLATEIETDVKAVPPQPGQPAAAEDLHFSGVIQSMSSTVWVIGGRTFLVSATTMLDTGLAVGVLAEVEFVTAADGSLQVVKIETAVSGKDSTKAQAGSEGQVVPQPGVPSLSGTDLNFTGAIQSVGPDVWVIGGQTFKVNAATMLDTGLAVGVQVEVEFIMQADGSHLATKIETLISGKDRVK